MIFRCLALFLATTLVAGQALAETPGACSVTLNVTDQDPDGPQRACDTRWRSGQCTESEGPMGTGSRHWRKRRVGAHPQRDLHVR